MVYFAEILLFRECCFLSHGLDKAQCFGLPKIYFGVCVIVLLILLLFLPRTFKCLRLSEIHGLWFFSFSRNLFP